MDYKDLYVELDTIGVGNYGHCVLVEECSSKTKYVAKKIITSELTAAELQRAKQEADVLRQLKHPNIVSYKESFTSQGKIVIIMENCEGGDLAKVIKKHAELTQYFSEPQVLVWFSQLVKALEFIHSHNILHRDIKASNIFLGADGTIKLGDFGISKILNSSCDVAHTLVGTPLCMSPELCNHQAYARKSDIWALGCVFYEICALKPPFMSASLLTLIAKITKEHPEPLPARYSENIKDLVFSMLIKDEDARISTKELQAHSVFTDYYFNPMQSIEITIGDYRDSCINPLDICEGDEEKNGFIEEVAEEESEHITENSVEDDDIPQDERINDDDEVVIQTRSTLISMNSLSREDKDESRSSSEERVVILRKKEEALKKFEPQIYEIIYQHLKKHRQLRSQEDIVYSELMERFTDFDIRDFIIVDQIIYYEEKLL